MSAIWVSAMRAWVRATMETACADVGTIRAAWWRRGRDARVMHPSIAWVSTAERVEQAMYLSTAIRVEEAMHLSTVSSGPMPVLNRASLRAPR